MRERREGKRSKVTVETLYGGEYTRNKIVLHILLLCLPLLQTGLAGLTGSDRG